MGMGRSHKLIKLLTIYVYFIIYMNLSINTSFRLSLPQN